MRTKYAFLFLLAAPLAAQGFLPGVDKNFDGVAASSAPIVMGAPVPQNVLVQNEERQKSTLLSHKTALDIMVVAFISQECPADEKSWRFLRDFYDRYRDWRVAFLAVSPKEGESLTRLQEDLNRRHLKWPLARDPDGLAAQALVVPQLPMIVIIDESGYIRYRGPLEQAEEALRNVIGHIDPVKDPEPPMGAACAAL